MKKYTIKYYFDGYGEVEIKAKSKKEAEKKFIEGAYKVEDEEEWGDNYCIETVE